MSSILLFQVLMDNMSFILTGGIDDTTVLRCS